MKVIVALDLTESASQIVEQISRKHWPDQTAFRLITVIERLGFRKYGPTEVREALCQLNETREQMAYNQLAAFKQELEQAVPGCSVFFEIRHGDPRIEILEAATDWMGDKVILGAHGHADNRLFAGSTSRTLTQFSGCAVELIRLGSTKQNPEIGNLAGSAAI